MSTHTITGTTKVGRWEYPATLEVQTGTVMRNAKRDGSGEWVREDRSKFAPTPMSFDVAIRPLYRLFSYVFDAFAVDGKEAHKSANIPSSWTEAVTNDALRELAAHGLLVRNDGGDSPVPLWQSTVTYDHISPEEAGAWFEVAMEAGPDPELLAAASKPIKAPKRRGVPWLPGTQCPQGHTLGESDIYVMPSGRKQCRQCRGGYDSNI